MKTLKYFISEDAACFLVTASWRVWNLLLDVSNGALYDRNVSLRRFYAWHHPQFSYGPESDTKYLYISRGNKGLK